MAGNNKTFHFTTETGRTRREINFFFVALHASAVNLLFSIFTLKHFHFHFGLIKVGMRDETNKRIFFGNG